MDEMPPPGHALSGETPLRVLVADDIAASREEIGVLVRQFGHSVLLATGGRDALDVAAREEPDVVLLDLLMPDLDGFEVARELRRRVTDRWLPVVVTSSLQGDEHFIEALSCGADDCLARPVTPALLEAKLRHYQRVLGLQSRAAALAQRQQAIIDHIGDAIVTVDAAGRITEFNRAAAALFNAGPDDALTGALLVERLGIDPRRLPETTEAGVRDGAGNELTMTVSAATWQLNRQPYTTLALHDLTQERQLQRMKDEFLGAVSHELRTPLTSIRGAVGLLDSGVVGALPAAAKELVEVAGRNSERLSRLIDDVLDITKLEAGVTLHLQTAQLADLVAEAVAAIDGYAKGAGVRVEVSSLAAGEGQVDIDRFLQVMANLLSNAVKHSSSGQVVTISSRGSPEGWMVAVSDQGPGIDPRFRSRLFEKFAQADSSDRRALGGTGLGLYISRALVERMGGRILVESEPGKGSTFTVLLPARGPRAQWLLCVARDRQRLDQFEDWLAPLARVETATDLRAAADLVALHGPVLAIVADPQGQGPVDEFCRELRSTARTVVLAGDSLDDRFARDQGLTWVSLAADDGRPRLVSLLQPLADERVRSTGG